MVKRTSKYHSQKERINVRHQGALLYQNFKAELPRAVLPAAVTEDRI
jgi:hypothetical protein